jgi:hypothetical protein
MDRKLDLPDENWRHWFAGFCCAEVCFAVYPVTKDHKSYRCFWQVKVRADDDDLVYELAKIIGHGYIRYDAGRRVDRNDNASITLRVQTQAGCQRIVDLLDGIPIRGKKAAEYKVWSTAVKSWATKTEPGCKRDWTQLASWGQELRKMKLYKATPRCLAHLSQST